MTFQDKSALMVQAQANGIPYEYRTWFASHGTLADVIRDAPFNIRQWCIDQGFEQFDLDLYTTSTDDAVEKVFAVRSLLDDTSQLISGKVIARDVLGITSTWTFEAVVEVSSGVAREIAAVTPVVVEQDSELENAVVAVAVKNAGGNPTLDVYVTGVADMVIEWKMRITTLPLTSTLVGSGS